MLPTLKVLPFPTSTMNSCSPISLSTVLPSNFSLSYFILFYLEVISHLFLLLLVDSHTISAYKAEQKSATHPKGICEMANNWPVESHSLSSIEES